MQLLAFEIGGAVLLVLGIAMLWFARPVDGRPAMFLRKREAFEIGYTMAVLVTLAGGLAGVLLGLTT